MPHPAADRNLLFGILALQMDFIRRDDLVAAMHAWVLDKDRSLGQILCTQGVLSGQRCTLLEALVQEHLKQHGDDTQRSLAAVSSLPSVRQDLQQLADADVQASLAHVAPAPQGVDPHATRDPAVDPPASPEVDPYATRTASVGAPTSSGARFLILRPHARGGLGEVFVAHDEELHREVALKEIQAQHADDPQSRSRFVLEAKVTGGLEHPGIVPVYGLGTYADGRPFYAMRFIRGDSLEDALERFHRAEGAGRDPGERALELRQLLGRFVDVCQAIAYAHSRGVLHRDLKPGNIMLGKYGETLVVDWGLAKPLDRKEARTDADEPTLHPASSDSLGQTMPGSVIGTPQYMSPEQAAGRLDLLGPASDVYSLGATLYSLLTGKPPFEEKDLGALLRKVQQGDFPPPRQVHRRTPAALEAICLKAMARKPQDRYPSPGALADDLEHWLADEPVAAYREPLSARLGRWARRHRTLVLATGALLGTAVVALAIGTVLLRQEQKKTEGQRQQAVAALQREEQARKERALAQVEVLVEATPQAVPSIRAGLEPYRQDVLPRLHELWDQEDRPDNHARRLRAGLALLPADVPGVKDQLYAEMLRAKDPGEMLLLRDALRPYRADFTATLWRKVDDQQGTAEDRFRALVALAAFDGTSDRWRTAGDDRVVAQFLSANPLHLGLWLEALRPVRLSLLDSLGRAFRDGDHPDRRQVAATVLADYAADRPDVLADLVADADARQYAVLLPRLQAHADRAVALLEQELDRTLPPDWQDPPLNPSWKTPAPDLVQQIEKAQGLVAERFALCQTLPLDQFDALAAALRQSGYRPMQFRPYTRGQAVQVAAVWTRDGKDWRLAHGLSADEVRQRDVECRQQGYRPLDVTSYLAGAAGANARGQVERYAVLWARPEAGGEDVQMYVGVPSGEQNTAAWQPLQKTGYVLRTGTLLEEGGQTRYSAIWWNPARPFDTNVYKLGGDESWYESNLTPSNFQVDVRLIAVLSQGHLERQYSAVWHTSAVRESAESHGLEAVPHLRRARELAPELAAGGYLGGLARAGRAPVTASVWHRPVVPDAARDALARRQAQAAVALLQSGRAERIWPLFQHSAEPRLRSYLLDRVGPLHADAQAVVQRLGTEPDVSARRALILALGEFTAEELPEEVRARLVPRLLEWYRTDPDPGIHGALDWLLRHGREGPDPRKLDWGQAAALERIDRELATQARAALLARLARPVGLLAAPPGSGALLAAPASLPEMLGAASGERRWYVSPTGQTLTVCQGPVEFLMGSPGHEPGRFTNEVQHRRRIGRSFAIATRLVTVAQFEEFHRAHPEVSHAYRSQYSPEPEGPIVSVTWYDAAEYCRWLSEQEGIAEEEMCYPPIAEIEKSKREGVPLRLPAAQLSRTGYRLPTEAEWEYACRAEAVTARYYGSGDELLGRYAWYIHNAQDRAWPVGQKRPNDFGLFDMQGEVWEWCQDAYAAYQLGGRGQPAQDMGDNKDIIDKNSRVLRGGSFYPHASQMRSAHRHDARPANRIDDVGLRVARTHP